MSDYRLTFAEDADGAPLHVLDLLTDYVVAFKKDGKHIDSAVEAWVIVGTDGYSTVRAIPWDEATSVAVAQLRGAENWTGPTRRIDLAEFDEVEYQ